MTKQTEHYGIGPQHKGDTPFTKRMRFHQSWYRANVLRMPCGTGPGPQHINKFGNMLTREDGARGLNFLTPAIFEVAKSRMEEEQGMVEEFRLLHNMLSSQPMCFNLFGPMVTDHKLAKRLFNQIFPGEVKEIVNVKIEYAPEPASEYLDDRTAFDAFVDFIGPDNKCHFIGIETKLTEPFSQKEYDGPAYRRWSDREDSPWLKEAWPKLANIRHNQLWRDHLLSVAMTVHSQSPYDSGFLMLIYHPKDKQCDETKEIYQNLLKPEDKSFLDYPLDKLIKAIDPQLESDSQKNWLNDFKKRYLTLSLSEQEWQGR
jgi:hypothetical protein